MPTVPIAKCLNLEAPSTSQEAVSDSLRAGGYTVVESVHSTASLPFLGISQAKTGMLYGVRVLVVDDEEMARDLVTMILTQAGAVVIPRASVVEALTTLAMLPPDQYPDVLVSDISMPDEDGYSLIGRLRQLPPDCGGRLPAIALTAHGRLEDRLRILGAGFQSHLTKPVESEELVLVIANLIRRQIT